MAADLPAAEKCHGKDRQQWAKSGGRLFGETSGNSPMRLVSAATVGDSLTFLRYERG